MIGVSTEERGPAGCCLCRLLALCPSQPLALGMVLVNDFIDMAILQCAASRGLRSFFDVSLSKLLSLSSCLTSIAAISTILYNSDSLLTLSLQLLFQVCVFSFKADPNASTSREISFQSCVQHPHRLTTASVVWIWNTTLSLSILHACRSWLPSVSHWFSSLLTLPPPFGRGTGRRNRHTMHCL